MTSFLLFISGRTNAAATFFHGISSKYLWHLISQGSFWKIQPYSPTSCELYSPPWHLCAVNWAVETECNLQSGFCQCGNVPAALLQYGFSFCLAYGSTKSSLECLSLPHCQSLQSGEPWKTSVREIYFGNWLSSSRACRELSKGDRTSKTSPDSHLSKYRKLTWTLMQKPCTSQGRYLTGRKGQGESNKSKFIINKLKS